MTQHERRQPEEWDAELDGVIAAPNSHVPVYENDHLRVLAVTMQPSAREPLHHHARRSTFLVINSAPLRYYNSDGTYFDIPKREVSAQAPYKEELEPERLHSVENLSSEDTYFALRIEYKN